MAVATATSNALRKLGAHLRWLLEREGVDPEQCVISLGVPDEVARSQMISALLRDFDAATMTRHDGFAEVVVVHGVPICITVSARSIKSC